MITPQDIEDQSFLWIKEDGSFSLDIAETDEVNYSIIGQLEVCERDGGVGIDYLEITKVEDCNNQALNWIETLIDKEKLKQTLLGFKEIKILIEDEEDRIGASRSEDFTESVSSISNRM